MSAPRRVLRLLGDAIDYGLVLLCALTIGVEIGAAFYALVWRGNFRAFAIGLAIAGIGVFVCIEHLGAVRMHRALTGRRQP